MLWGQTHLVTTVQPKESNENHGKTIGAPCILQLEGLGSNQQIPKQRPKQSWMKYSSILRTKIWEVGWQIFHNVQIVLWGSNVPEQAQKPMIKLDNATILHV